MSDNPETPADPSKFDFSAFPADTLFFDRREGQDRRDWPKPIVAEVVVPKRPPERRAKKERRRRIDPTTFEKQYTEDEIEFMNAVQKFKNASGKSFPTHGEILRVAASLGYRKNWAFIEPDINGDEDTRSDEEAETTEDLPCLPA